MNKRQIGNVGEKYACDFLRSRGYKIMDKNWTCYAGEIDIVALKSNTLVFVEVKYVRNNFCSPADLFSKHKKISLNRAVLSYLEKTSLKFIDWRADLVCVSGLGRFINLDHYENIL